MTALYRLFDTDGTLLYIGISIRWAQRMAQHKSDKSWWPSVARIDITNVDDKDARHIEATAIRAEHPRFNIASTRPVRKMQVIRRRQAVPVVPKRRRQTWPPNPNLRFVSKAQLQDLLAMTSAEFVVLARAGRIPHPDGDDGWNVWWHPWRIAQWLPRYNRFRMHNGSDDLSYVSGPNPWSQSRRYACQWDRDLWAVNTEAAS